jgi:hypothetical protein
VSERPKRTLLYVLAALILLEGAAVTVGTVYLVVEILVAPTASIASAAALAVCAAIAAAALILIAINAVKGRPWIRGASICWQIIQALVGVSILQAKASDSLAIAVALIVPAVAIVVLLFTPTVVAATTRSRES